MNIFYLHNLTPICAQYHNDRHCVKMILEYAQLLSTAHRILDGVQFIDASSGRKIKRWYLTDPTAEYLLYKATHINHPSAVWAREREGNYVWLSQLLLDLCKEYTHRYGKIHKCESDGLVAWLVTYVPENITLKSFTEPTPAMPDDCKVAGDSLASYRKYYIQNKHHLAKWKNRDIPDWYTDPK
jgi:hypothetical protein